MIETYSGAALQTQEQSLNEAPIDSIFVEAEKAFKSDIADAKKRLAEIQKLIDKELKKGVIRSNVTRYGLGHDSFYIRVFSSQIDELEDFAEKLRKERVTDDTAVANFGSKSVDFIIYSFKSLNSMDYLTK